MKEARPVIILTSRLFFLEKWAGSVQTEQQQLMSAFSCSFTQMTVNNYKRLDNNEVLQITMARRRELPLMRWNNRAGSVGPNGVSSAATWGAETCRRPLLPSGQNEQEASVLTLSGCGSLWGMNIVHNFPMFKQESVRALRTTLSYYHPKHLLHICTNHW